MTPVEGWQAHAACRFTLTPDDWFPDTRTLTAANHRAIATCHRCPVRQLCAASATPGDVGIWGGEVHTDRVRRKQLIPAQRTRDELVELFDKGWTLGELARVTDSTEHTLRRLRKGQKPTLRPELAQAIHRAYLDLRRATAPNVALPTKQEVRKGTIGPGKGRRANHTVTAGSTT